MKVGRLRLIICGFALFTSSLVAAQNARIMGTVRTSDGTPAEYVNLALKGTAKGAVADKNGKYEINGVAPGAYTLVTSFVGLVDMLEKHPAVTALVVWLARRLGSKPALNLGIRHT